MQLLRDPDWFRVHQPEVGGTIYLDMGEMGVEGDAIVEAIGPCPEIEPGEGRVVTATFHHSIGECLELDIEGEDEPLRVTAGHPIWRADRSDSSNDFANSIDCCGDISAAAGEIIELVPQLREFELQLVSMLASAAATVESSVELLNLHPNWIAAGHLQTGDTLSTVNGDARISAIQLDHTPCPVFNIEVQGDHVYRVHCCGILAHNDSGCLNNRNWFIDYGDFDNWGVERGTSDHYGGRPKGVHAFLTPATPLGSGPYEGLIPPGWSNLPSLNRGRGHLLARQLGGSGSEAKNIVALFQNNANTPAMYECENRIAEALGCECIEVRITPVYNPNEGQPTAIRISAVGDRAIFRLNVSIANSASANTPRACKKD